MSGALATAKSKAADLLLQARVLSRKQYDYVVAQVHATQERAEEIIVDTDVMNEADLLKALSGIYKTHFVSSEKLSKADIPRATVQMIPRRVAEMFNVFPVLFDRQSGILSVVTPDPDNTELLREVKLASGAQNVKAFVTRPAAVAAAIRKHHQGDPRAFEHLERRGGLQYDFGQQVLADGRVVGAKDSFRANMEDFEAPGAATISPPAAPGAHPSPPPAAPPPSSPQPQPPPVPKARSLASDSHANVPSARPARPPPVPEHGAAARNVKRAVASLSAPPPAMPSASPAPYRPPVPSRVPAPKPARSVDSSPNVPPPPPAIVRTSKTRPPAADAARQMQAQDTTVELLTVMVSLLENARQELRGHSSQVSRLLRRVAERMNLDRGETHAVIVAAHIHDLGKMGQFHLTALNCSEYEGHRTAAMKAHDTPLRLLEAVRLPPSIKNAVFHMYERFDGKGFPDKLAAKEIPLGARLLSVADTYADLTQNQRNPFRKVLGPAEAMNVLMQHKGTIFDPSLLDLFKALVLGEDMRAKLLANRYSALIVDSDPEESTVLELRLVEQGFDVRTARTVEAARKILQTEGADLDLVVCEVELPDADGLAFLSEARRESWGREVPWVVHTHKQGRTEAQRAFELGAMDFVAKPVQADVLVAKLKAMLDQATSKKTSKGVSGSLREMGLPDIVQVLFHGRKTGKLDIRAGGKIGEIHFLEGNIADAVLDDLHGADAFYAMLKFDEGDFALDPSFTAPKRIITQSSEALLLEGMRRMDEGL